MHHVGIALATTLAGWVNTGLLIAVLWRRGHFTPDLTVLRKLMMVMIASLLMGLCHSFLGAVPGALAQRQLACGCALQASRC